MLHSAYFKRFLQIIVWLCVLSLVAEPLYMVHLFNFSKEVLEMNAIFGEPPATFTRIISRVRVEATILTCLWAVALVAVGLSLNAFGFQRKEALQHIAKRKWIPLTFGLWAGLNLILILDLIILFGSPLSFYQQSHFILFFGFLLTYGIRIMLGILVATWVRNQPKDIDALV